jgi:hypothetical protein
VQEADMNERQLPEGLPDRIVEHVTLYRKDPDKGHMWGPTADGGEREAIWVQMEAIYPPYRDYQAVTDRRIPVVVLERI